MMKKIYSKPDIFFEDFSLNTNIAAGCELQPTGYIGENFFVDMGTLVLLNDDNYCDTVIKDGENEFDNLCYHVPYEEFNVFNS